MEIGGGADRACSEDRNVAGGRGTAVGAGGGGNGLVKGCTVDVCSVGGAGASVLFGTWVGGIQGVRSTVGHCPSGGVELEDARFDPLSRANSSAMLAVMLAANRLTVPSSAVKRAWSSEADDVCETRGRGTPEDVGGGRCVGGVPEYAGSMPAGVEGGGACVGGG
ncbi:uncharacterized protein LOC116188775 [Punica granatum]|uniref:Uncharacterized protein LOC116188775 n=1 Tax=Punica granatum TaxID=22663 RepID=A0A6P8BY16_PUNGR|nr:uncharacterized protein LOC116188775 [Punica granatum]